MRHGETPWNKEGRFQGHSLVGLSERGIMQARQVARALPRLKPTALYASPLPRTLMTAEEISKELSIAVVPLEGLKEVNLGELEGITGQEMRTQHGQVYSAWRKDPSDVVFPGGESIRQLQQRAWSAIEGIEKAHPNGVIVVVSHNFAIRTILCRFLGMSLSQFHLLRVDLASMSLLRSDTSVRQVHTINDRCHLFQDVFQET